MLLLLLCSKTETLSPVLQSHSITRPSVEHDARTCPDGENTQQWMEYLCPQRGELGSSEKSSRLQRRHVLSPEQDANELSLNATALTSVIWAFIVWTKDAFKGILARSALYLFSFPIWYIKISCVSFFCSEIWWLFITPFLYLHNCQLLYKVRPGLSTTWQFVMVSNCQQLKILKIVSRISRNVPLDYPNLLT